MKILVVWAHPACIVDDSETVISRWTREADRADGIYRAVARAVTISVKCVTVEATGKASFDFCPVTINPWFTPVRGLERRVAVRQTTREIDLSRKSDYRTFYFVPFLRVARRRALLAADSTLRENSRASSKRLHSFFNNSNLWHWSVWYSPVRRSSDLFKEGVLPGWSAIIMRNNIVG